MPRNIFLHLFSCADAFFDCVFKASIEGSDLFVVGHDLKVDFHAITVAQGVFRNGHDLGADAEALVVRAEMGLEWRRDW